jgi:hypothetical protein
MSGFSHDATKVTDQGTLLFLLNQHRVAGGHGAR